MTRVFYRPPDPTDDADNARLLFKGTCRYNAYGVVLLPDGDAEVGTYGEPDTFSAQETTDLVPWHRVDYVEGFPRPDHG